MENTVRFVLAIDSGAIILIVFAAILIALIFSSIKIVPQASVKILERLGSYQSTWQTGVHFKIPFIDRIARTISIKEQVADFTPQAVITRDNVTMQIDTVVFFQVTDPKLYSYGIENPIMAIENLSATTLRNIIGDLELDQTLTSRDLINTRMRIILDEATDPWGIKVNRVELKNILPPREIQDAMEKQMKAEREKREAILIAEGSKEAAIRSAEGAKQAEILRAEGKKEAAIREAEGQAQAIREVYEARAQGMQFLKDVHADSALLALRSMEAMEKVADGKATKIIIPSEMQNLSAFVSGIQALASTPDPVAEDVPVQASPAPSTPATGGRSSAGGNFNRR